MQAAQKIYATFSNTCQAKYSREQLEKIKPPLQCFRKGTELFIDPPFPPGFEDGFEDLVEQNVFNGYLKIVCPKKVYYQQNYTNIISNSNNTTNSNNQYNKNKTDNSMHYQHNSKQIEAMENDILNKIRKQRSTVEQDIIEFIGSHFSMNYIKFYLGSSNTKKLCKNLIKEINFQFGKQEKRHCQSQKNCPTNSEMLEKQSAASDESNGQEEEERQDLQDESNASQMSIESNDSKIPLSEQNILDEGEQQNQEEEQNSNISNEGNRGSQISIESEGEQQQSQIINQDKPGQKSAQTQYWNPFQIPGHAQDSEKKKSLAVNSGIGNKKEEQSQQEEMQPQGEEQTSEQHRQTQSKGRGNAQDTSNAAKSEEGGASPLQRSSMRNARKQPQSYKCDLTRQYNQKQPPKGSDVNHSSEEAVDLRGDGAVSNDSKKQSKNSQPIKVDKGKKPGQKFKYKCGHWDYLGKKIPEEEVCDECKQQNSKAENLKQKFEYSQGFTNHLATPNKKQKQPEKAQKTSINLKDMPPNSKGNSTISKQKAQVKISMRLDEKC